MGLLTVKPQSLAEVADEVFFPKVDLHSSRPTGERSRVLNMPGIKALVDATIAKTEAPVRIFEVNRNIKGANGRVNERRPGIVAELSSDSTDDVLIETIVPVQSRLFDQTSMSRTIVSVPAETASTFTKQDLYAHAAAQAIFHYVQGTEQDMNRGDQ